MTRLLLFDVDGTLIRTHGAGVKAFAKTFATEFGINDGTEELNFAGRTDTSLVREFFLKNKIDPSPENFTRFFERYVFWLDYLLNKCRGEICVGVWSLLPKLANLPNAPEMGLLTGNIRLGAEIKLRHFQVWDFFEFGAFGDDDENRDRLAGVAFARARQVIDKSLKSEDILVIGDTPLDVQCAKSIGAKSLAVATGGATMEQLEKSNPTLLVPSLNSITVEEICQL